MSQKLDEAPHIAYNDKNFGTIDFQVEKMPISRDEKTKIAKAFSMGKGIIGRMPNTGKLLRFTQSDVKVIKTIPKDSTMLPNDWNKYAVIIRDNKKIAEQKIRKIIQKMIEETLTEKGATKV